MLKHYRVFNLNLGLLFAGLGLFIACQRFDEDFELQQLNKPKATYLFWSDLEKSSIMRATLHDTLLVAIDTLFTKIDGVKNPHGLTVDVDQQQLYWTEYATSCIMRADWSGKNVPDVLYNAADSVRAPVGLAFSAKLRQLFWTEPGSNRIQTAPTNRNTPPCVLYNYRDGVDGAFGIALAGHNLYWTEPGDNQVVRAAVTGLGLPSILYSEEHGLNKPFGLAIDTTANQLYILDNSLPSLSQPDQQDLIFRGSISGWKALAPVYQISNGVQNAYSLVIDRQNGKLYWLNQLNASIIMQGNLNGIGIPREFIRLNSIGFALAIAHPRQ